MSNDSESTGGVVSGKLPADTFQEFEEFRDERDLTKSDAVRRLVALGLESESEQQAGSKQVESGGDSPGLLSRILPSSVGAFLAASLMLVSLNQLTGATIALAASAISFLGLEDDIFPSKKEGTTNPMDAHKNFRRGYILLSSLVVVFILSVYSDRIVLGGAVEMAAFVLAFVLAYLHISADELSEFSWSNIGYLLLFNIGALAVVYAVTVGTSPIVIYTAAIGIVWGTAGILWTTAQLCWEVIPYELRAPTDDSVSQ